MKHRCRLCGRFTKRIKDAVGLPLLTAFPPDNPFVASTAPYAAFACENHGKFSFVQYDLVSFQFVTASIGGDKPNG